MTLYTVIYYSIMLYHIIVHYIIVYHIIAYYSILQHIILSYHIYIYTHIYLQPDDDLWTSNLHWTLGFPGPRQDAWSYPQLAGQSRIVYLYYIYIQRERDRQIDRQIDRCIHTQTYIIGGAAPCRRPATSWWTRPAAGAWWCPKRPHVDRQIDRQIERQIDRETDRQIDRYIDRQIDRQRERDREIERQIYRERERDPAVPFAASFPTPTRACASDNGL